MTDVYPDLIIRAAAVQLFFFDMSIPVSPHSRLRMGKIVSIEFPEKVVDNQSKVY